MGQYVGIKFRDFGQIYYFDSGQQEYPTGERLVVETEHGQSLGTVAALSDTLPEGVDPDGVKPVVRVAEPADLEKAHEHEALAKEAFAHCRERIRERELDMKLTDVEVYFDGSKIVFYFTAPGRVDFRELVKDLVRTYRTRIELRQIGVRHETQMLGAIGNCGQMCCCRRFLRKFAPVTIKMAKEQNLFLNPAKISGICGRLLCCLAYEQKNYEHFQRKCPKAGKRFTTGLGSVKVLRTNFFRQSISVLTEAGEERELTLDEWAELREQAPPPAAETGEDASTAAGGDTRPESRSRPERRPRPQRDKAHAEKGEGGQDAPLDGTSAWQAEARKPRRANRPKGPKPQRQDGDAQEARSPAQGKPADGQGDAKADAGEQKPKRKRRNRRRKRKPKSQGPDSGSQGSGGGQSE